MGYRSKMFLLGAAIALWLFYLGALLTIPAPSGLDVVAAIACGLALREGLRDMRRLWRARRSIIAQPPSSARP